MKKHAFLCVFAALALFLFCGQAEATWYWTHGSSGHVQSDATEIHSAAGLVVNPPDDTAWVHFQVPSIGDKTQGARFVRIRFEIVNALNSQIKQVKVYNGATLVKSFNVSWGGEGAQAQTLDLGGIKSFWSGMGVSILIQSGPDAGTDQYIFYGVGANFVPRP